MFPAISLSEAPVPFLIEMAGTSLALGRDPGRPDHEQLNHVE